MDDGRLPFLEPSSLDEGQRALYDALVSSKRSSSPGRRPLADERGRLQGPFNALLFSPQLGNAVQELGTVVRYGTSLSPRAREIAILEVARYCESDYEWSAHVTAAIGVGLSGHEISAIEFGEDAPSLDAKEALVRSATQALLFRRDLSDEEFAQLRNALGDGGIVDLVVLVSYYELLALLMRVTRTPSPPARTD